MTRSTETYFINTALLASVSLELEAAAEKHGEQLDLPSFHPNGHAIMDAFLAKHYTDMRARAGEVTWGDILLEEVAEAFEERDDPAKLREELIQVAAMAVAWIRALDHQSEVT